VREGETQDYPAGDPGIAYDLMRDRFMYQQMAVDGLDSKLAVVLGASGLVLTVVAAFLALREENLTTGETRFVIVEGVLFAVTAMTAVLGIWPLAWKGITWEQVVQRSSSRVSADEVNRIKWSIATGLKYAGDRNDCRLQFKAWLLRVTLVALVVQIVVAVVGMIGTVT